MSKRDMLSERRVEGYLKYAELITWARCNPVEFIRIFFGVELLDYQKYIITNSWTTPFVVWNMSRASGKSTVGALFVMAKSMLYPNYQTYILAAAGSQSQEMFLKMENIALDRISSFTGLTDVFVGETVKNTQNKTGFTHSPGSFEVGLHNGSTVNSLNSVPDNIRSKRSNLNFYDEAGFVTDELFEASEPFAVQSSDFRLGGSQDVTLLPKQLPNQLIYASSASATDTYFYKKYRDFSMKMMAGDSRYFVADIDSDAIINATFNGKLYPVPLLSQETVDAAMRSNAEKAMREYNNIFTTEGSDQQIIKRRTIVRNSELRKPLLAGDGKRNFVFAIDPARSRDNSVIVIAELINDKEIGYRAEIVNIINLIDVGKKKKRPMKTPDQVEEFKETLLAYNGANANDYDNIETILLDDGSGGGGISAWADYLLEEWTDSRGTRHKGLIDPEHHLYEEVVSSYPRAVDKLKLVTPQRYRNALFSALKDMMEEDLISFTENYDGRGELVFTETEGDNAGDSTVHQLSDDEVDALVNIDLAKEELVSIYEYKTGSSVRYDLAPDKKNRMNDDRAYAIAMIAWYLQNKRRDSIVKEDDEFDIKDFMYFRSSGF